MFGSDMGALKAINEIAISQTILEKLQDQRNALKVRLDDLDAAIAALKANPEIENLLNLVSRVY